jgi:osmoprotectant transport system ATP-binding protein
MTVGDNIAVVPRLLEWSDAQIAARVDRLLSIVGLEPGAFRDRFPAQLSGGQKQRIGVARALAADPPIVLMDEPFGALDPMVRFELQREFREIVRSTSKTALIVTHDLAEAGYLGDEVALMDQGRLVQKGPFRDLVERPASDFVKGFIEAQRSPLDEVTS